MDSIDKVNNMSAYPKTQGISAYNGVNHLVNQLNRDNSNTFNNQLAGKMQKLLTGEIIDLKSNEIIVRLDDGSNISAQIYDTTNLSIGQTIKFHLQDNKGVLILEPLKESLASSGNLVHKALEAAGLPITDKNVSLVTELLKNNMSLDSQSINNIVQQSNYNKDISVETLVLMNKHNIPITEENAIEIGKYRNYEHRLIKEIDNIANDVPKLINEVSKSNDYDTLMNFNSKLVSILTSNFNKVNNNQTNTAIQNSALNNYVAENTTNNINDGTSINREAPSVFPANNLPGVADITHTAPLLNDSLARLSSPNMISGDDASNTMPSNVGNVYNSNPEVASAYLKPSSAQELITILEPYNIPDELFHGIKDGTAPLRDVADFINKAIERADELDDYRVSDYYTDQQSPGSVEYGTVSARVSREMGLIDSYANLDKANESDSISTQNTVPNQSSNNNGYVNLSLAKDAFEHPVIKNILDKYEVLQRDNSEVASFQNFYNRGQLTSKLRDIPNTTELADRIWKGNISANELLVKIEHLLKDADPSDATKVLKSDQYQSVVREAIMNNWTISPNALKQKNVVKDTYDNMYHQLNELQSFVSKLSLDKSVTEHLSKELSGTKSNIKFMNTINNMFSYVQLPLKLREQNVHSDLYVMTNKQKLQQDKSNISVLLHLDMQYLGTMDININLSGNVVNTKFHVTDDYTRELLSKNMDQLEYAMLEKGFILSSSVDLKEKEVNLVNDFLSSDTPTTSIKRYTFDMRG